MITREFLIEFEKEVAEAFNAAKIRGPVHLDGGNEDQLIAYFAENFRPGDWVFATWRSHYKALLAGVPREQVMAEIMAGRSIELCFPDHNFVSSAIAGGIVPIALGVALEHSRRGSGRRTHCFVGDMVSKMGAFREAWAYARRNDLPIHFVVEDNGRSVCTPTDETWGTRGRENVCARIHRFSYRLPWPHSGAGTRVQF